MSAREKVVLTCLIAYRFLFFETLTAGSQVLRQVIELGSTPQLAPTQDKSKHKN